MLGKRGSSSILTHLTLRGLILRFALLFLTGRKQNEGETSFLCFGQQLPFMLEGGPLGEQAREMRDIPYLRLRVSFPVYKMDGNNSSQIIVLRYRCSVWTLPKYSKWQKGEAPFPRCHVILEMH